MTAVYFIANDVLDILYWKVHLSAISNFELAKILFQHFTSSLRPTAYSSSQTGST